MAADSKQYELIFLLRAQMDASLKQFSLVGGQVKELEQKIQQYNNTLKDISAYKRQTNAAEEYAQKLRQQEAALTEVTQRFSAATAAVKAAEQEVRRHSAAIEELNLKKAEQGKLTQEQRVKLELERRALKESRIALSEVKSAEKELLNQKNQSQAAVDRLREKLAQEQQKLIELSEALKKAGVDTKNLEEAEKSLARQVREATDEQDRLTEFADQVNDLADKFTVLKMAAGGVESAMRPLMNFFQESLGAAAKLEYGMSAVQAVSGATRKETEQLAAVVKEMGATTIYTAEQSAKAMQNMALAGWDPRQMISGLPAVIKLAAASGEDLAEMTSIVSDGMNAFQLSGEKAAVKFADVLAKAATSSNTNVGLLGQSLSYVETTAGNLGYAIEDVSVLLAAMANNALKGGVSGSALNTMLTRMSGANETAAKQMEKMGLSMYYTTDAMGHAAGEAKDLMTFTNELREAFREFGDDAQAAQVAAYNLAGMRGMRGLLAIVNQSDAQWQKLTNDVYSYAGAADQISGVRMDNYTGQMYLLTSAWDALQTSVGEQFLPTATDALGVLTDITNGANEFVQNHGGIVRGIAAVTATTLGLTAGVTALATVIEGIRFAMTALSATKLITLVGGFGGLLAISAAAGIAVAAFTSSVEDSVPSVRELTEQTRGLDRAMEQAKGTYEQTAASVQATADVADSYIDKLEEIEAAEGAGAAQNREYQNTLALLLQLMPELSGSISQTTDAYGRSTYALESDTAALRANTAAWRENAEEKAYQEYLNTVYEKYNGVLVEQAENEIKLTQAKNRRETAEKNLESALIRLGEVEREAAENGGAVSQEYYQLQNAIAGYRDEIEGTAEEAAAYQKAVDKSARALAEAKSEWESARAAVEELSRAEREGAGAGEDLMRVFEASETALDNLNQAYTEAYEAAYSTFSSMFGLYEEVEEKQRTTVGELTRALKSQEEYWNSYRTNLEAIQKAAKDAGIDLSGLWSTLADGSQGSAAAVGALAGSLKGGDISALKSYVDQYKETMAAIEGTSALVSEESEAVKAALEQAEKDILEAVQNTEAYDEAYAAMESTMQGYLDGLENKEGALYRSIARVGQNMKYAIDNSFSYRAVTHPASDSAWYANSTAPIPAFANGTDFAPRGLALVGEQGPELVMLSGGERVIPAEKTERILENGAPALTVDDSVAGSTMELNLNFTVEGDATPETVRALRDYGGDIEKIVERVLRRQGVDAKRRAFT